MVPATHQAAMEPKSSEPVKWPRRDALRPGLVPLQVLVCLLLGDQTLLNLIVQPVLKDIVLRLGSGLLYGVLNVHLIKPKDIRNSGREAPDRRASIIAV